MFIKDLEKYQTKNKYSQFVKQYYLDINKNGINNYISNIDIEIKFIEIDDYLISLTFGNNNKNCYTVSLIQIFNYGKYELTNINNVFQRFIFKHFFNLLIYFGKKLNIEESIYINNFLLSTNLYPDFGEKTLKKINVFIKKYFPNKIIFYRSLNLKTNKKIINFLEKQNFKKLCLRQIFIFEKEKIEEYRKLKIVKNDQRIIKKYGFKIEKVEKKDSQEILKLYDLLYIGKYSSLNPQFTKNFIEELIVKKIFNFYKVSDNNGKILGILGYFIINNQATTPIFGYNIYLDRKINMYSQISNILTFKVLKEVYILNSSSGAGKFKKSRGAELFLEYSLIYLPDKSSILKKIYFKILFLLSKLVLEKQLKDNIY